MTWLDYMKRYDPNIDDRICEYILWEETAFPCSCVRTTAYQARSAIRSALHKIKRCELCGWMKPFHQKGCLNKEDQDET